MNTAHFNGWRTQARQIVGLTSEKWTLLQSLMQNGSMKPSLRKSTLLLGAVLALALPGSALAATSTQTSTANGTVAEELTITPAAIPSMTLARGQFPDVQHNVVAKTTFASYSLNIKSDQADGKMHKTGNNIQDLAAPLQWKRGAGGTYADLTGTDASTGGPYIGDGTHTFYFRQAVGATEAIAANDTYTLDIIYTAVSN